MGTNLSGKRILATDYFEEKELTSRNPDDLPAFNKALIESLGH